MTASTTLRQLMATPLPGRNQQLRSSYRPNIRQVIKIYNLLNQVIFKNKLTRPKIVLAQQRKKWGECEVFDYKLRSGSSCIIKINNKWSCIQWLITILAHEMAHQYQWDIIGPTRLAEGKDPLIGHGPSFFQHRARLYKYKIPLRIRH
jgi:hypothetical protein